MIIKLLGLTLLIFSISSCTTQEEVWINGCKYIKITELNGDHYDYDYIPTNICNN